MRDEEIAPRREVPLDHRDDALLDDLVEVDHDVAAEDDVEALVKVVDLDQIQPAVLDGAAHVRAHAHFAFVGPRPRSKYDLSTDCGTPAATRIGYTPALAVLSARVEMSEASRRMRRCCDSGSASISVTASVTGS